MKRYLPLLFVLTGFLSTPVHALTCDMPVTDIVMADSDGEEEEKEPDCD
jgi:hypothetical protein